MKNNDKIILCVNIDHIATVRQARGGAEPDVINGAKLCEKNGADGITVHLREDRRHIQDKDVFELKKIVKGKYNLEMALSDEIIGIAKKVLPDQITLVPERRQERTTEGGLDVKRYKSKIIKAVREFHDLNIVVSLFIEPESDVVEMSKDCGADYIEIHTGAYCEAKTNDFVKTQLARIYEAAECANKLGIKVNAGHGLNYTNIQKILKTPGLREVNIGHSIISRSIFTGLPSAVKDMSEIIKKKK